MTKRYWPRKRKTPALAFGCFLAILGLPASAQTPASPNPPPAQGNSGDLRFAVAHQHMASWCYGYLYVAGSQVRYEVVQPQSDRRHSFTADRANVVVSHRTLFGQPAEALKPFINLKIKGQSYNFLWLANESEVKTGGSHRMTPPQAAPPDMLFAALQNLPAAAATQDTATQAAAVAAGNLSGSPSQTLWNQSANATAGASPQDLQAQPPAAQEDVPGDVRFAVAHHHKDGSWCYGYLYVTHDQVRYEVVQPESDSSHAFALSRSGLKARPWIPKANAPAEYLQASHDAFELEFKRGLQHFRWLANQDDVNSGNARPANPPQAAPPDILIRTIQTPTARIPVGIPSPAPVLGSQLKLAMNRINDARPGVWR